MKIRFIFNPRSGRNARRPSLAPSIQAYIRERNLDATLVTTARPHHATELARAAVAEGCDRVVAVGGDGTMNEVAQALLHSPAALGLIPCGSGNGLALHLGIPLAAPRALALATDPHARAAAIDTGTVNGLPFFNAMGLGFDADISERFNHLTRRGLPAYVRTGIRAWIGRRTETVIVRGGGHSAALDILLVAVANSDQYGNNARIAPGARVDDGLLDLVAVRPVSMINVLPLVARLFAGQFHTSPRVMRLRDTAFTIERPAAGLVHTDGETHATGATLSIRVLPRSLRLLVPAHARLIATNDRATPRDIELQLP
ncbi:MAG: YegS/Rv2252/BmrU family lipid kinase [Verrucomicrobia bacterium]|nr:YegS/Rv2252/BmrU family lipid kinase [Verrucomicrobiota bacterium]